MEPNPNKYALAALKDRRASIAGLITEAEAKLRYLRKSIEHIDGTIRLFSDLDPDTIAAKKPYKRVKLFGQGELNRLIFGALRKADKPMSTAEIVTAIIEELGHGPDAAKGMTHRVRANLQYLARNRGLIAKEGDRLNARWSIRA